MELTQLAFIIFISYVLISVFFLYFPNILHPKKSYRYRAFNDLINSNQLFCIGHRGGGWEGPQNTIELFQKNQQKVHMFELDVCLTKDKQLVVHHDANVFRTCGEAIKISDCNYDDLPRFKKEFQSFAGPMLTSEENKIPLLDDVFKRFPLKPMNIELKTPSEEAIKQFNRLVQKYQREDITVWGVARRLNEQLRKENQEVINFYSAGQIFKIYILFLTGLLPFVPLRQGVMDIPLYTSAFYDLALKMFQSRSAKWLAFLVFSLLRCFNFFSYFFIPHLKKRGILTFYFILNTDQDFERAVSTGCSGIMTDVTENLKSFLARKELYYDGKKERKGS